MAIGHWTLRICLLVAPVLATAVREARAACDDGGIAWIRQLASPKNITLLGLAATPDGGVVAAGEFQTALQVLVDGEKPQELRARKDKGSFVLKLSSRGRVAWMRRLAGVDDVTAFAVGPDGEVAVAGAFRRQAALEGAPGAAALPFPGDVPQKRLYVGVYASDGTPRAARVAAEVSAAGSGGQASIDALAVGKGGALALAGTFGPDLTINGGGGGGGQTRKLTARNGSDIFAAVLAADGAAAWALRIGGDQQERPGRIAFAPDGSVLLNGYFWEHAGPSPPPGTKPGATLGDDPSIVLRAIGNVDSFVARIDAGGHVAWAQAIGGDERNKEKPTPGVILADYPEGISSLLPTADGGVMLAGIAPFPVRFGRDKPRLGGEGVGSGGFLARLSPAGHLRGAVLLDGGQRRATTFLPDGDVVVVGEFDGSYSYLLASPRRVTLTSAGHDDVVLARHAPDGALRWATRFGGTGDDTSLHVTSDTAGAVTFAALFERDFAIGADGCHTVRAAPPDTGAVFLVRIAPGAVLSDQPRERRLAATRAEVAALRKTAARAFKAKSYATACPAYEKIAALLPEDGAAMADLALCLQRLDRKAEAIAANQKGIALAASTELSRDGDPATRRHAYFNLGKLGVAIELPSGGCRQLPAAPGCGSALWACVQAGEAYGSGGGSSWHVARIAVSRDEAEIGKDDDPLPAMPSMGLSGHASDSVAWERDHNFFQRAPSVDVLADKLDESFCHEGASDDCGRDDGETRCAVVIADACLGLVGVVCPGGATGRDRDAVDEFYLEPVK